MAGIAEAVHLAVLGFSCELVEDPGGEVAAALERNLQPWSTQQVLVDRFDARLLLGDSLPPPARYTLVPHAPLRCMCQDGACKASMTLTMM
jgi:hypothetical protein